MIRAGRKTVPLRMPVKREPLQTLACIEQIGRASCRERV